MCIFASRLAMNVSEVYEKTSTEIAEEAYRLYSEMKDNIEKIVSKVKNFNRAYEPADYFQEAYSACIQAQTDYCKYMKTGRTTTDTQVQEDLAEYLSLINGSTRMKLSTYAYWLVQKKVYNLADCNEIQWYIYDKEGVFKGTMLEKEFRKNKERLRLTGHTFTPGAMFVTIKTYDEEDRDAGELGDSRMLGFGSEDCVAAMRKVAAGCVFDAI